MNGRPEGPRPRFCPQHQRGTAALKTQTVLPMSKALSGQGSVVGWDGPHGDTSTKPRMGQLMTIKHLSPHRTVWEAQPEEGPCPKGKLLILGSYFWSREVGKRLPVSFLLGWGLAMPTAAHQPAHTCPTSHRVALQDSLHAPLRAPHFAQAVPSSGMRSLNHS